MTAATAGVRIRIRRYWLAPLVVVSVALLAVTVLSFPLAGNGMFSRVLFLAGFAGENNVGAWWSGTLLLLAGLHAFDGFHREDKTQIERRGWLSLSIVLLMLSFDEVSSLHEYLLNTGLLAALPYGLLGAGLVAYSIGALVAARSGARTIAPILLAFALFAAVPLHEYVQQTRAWSNPLVYGLRTLLEEGTEIAAMLILIAVTRHNTFSDHTRAGGAFCAATEWRRPLIRLSIPMIPALTAATFALPYPGGPADWLAASLYALCAVAVLGAVASGTRPPTRSVAWLVLFYIGASAASVAAKLDWHPSVLGVEIGIRGLAVALILVAAAPALVAAGRDAEPARFALAALAVLAASFYPHSQLLWCAIPPIVALWIYAVETRVPVPEQVGVAGRSVAVADQA